jgi:hypothetical protein
MRRRALTVVVLGGVVTLTQACIATVPVVSPTPAPLIVTIEAGITPRMTPEQVEAIVIAQIHGMESMVGYVVRPPRILTVAASSGIRWTVRAEGTFTNNRYPPGGRPGVAATGYFGINDVDGSVVEFGYP